MIEIERSISKRKGNPGSQVSIITYLDYRTFPSALSLLFPYSQAVPTPSLPFHLVVLSHTLCNSRLATSLVHSSIRREKSSNFIFRLHSYQFLQHPHDLYHSPPIPPILLLLLNPRVPVSELVQFRSVSFTTSPPFPCFTR